MIKNPDEIAETLRMLGITWAELDGAANLLEESLKSVRAQIALKYEGSAAYKEMMAYASADYREHVAAMVTARTESNKAKVNYECIKVKIELIRTLESSRRAEMTMR